MRAFVWFFTWFLTITFVYGSAASAGTTVVVSVDSTGKQGNSYSNEPAISADGRYVAFHSWGQQPRPE